LKLRVAGGTDRKDRIFTDEEGKQLCIMKRTSFNSFTLYDMDGNTICSYERQRGFFTFKVTMLDGEGKVKGIFQQKATFLGQGWDIKDANDDIIGTLTGKIKNYQLDMNEGVKVNMLLETGKPDRDAFGLAFQIDCDIDIDLSWIGAAIIAIEAGMKGTLAPVTR
jgi:hypothetical protein